MGIFFSKKTPQVATIVKEQPKATTITVGSKIPDSTFMTFGDAGPAPLSSSDVFDGKKVVVFGLPGAMTPTCSEQQLPDFVANAEKIKAKGFDAVACIAVNDPFVMNEWLKVKDPEKQILMLADGGAEFTTKAGLNFDTGHLGGVRMKRCAFVVESGKVVKLGVEDDPLGFNKEVSGATAMADI